jgi:hypothetical protein
MQEEKFYAFVRELVKHDPVLAESIINGHMAILEGYFGNMAHTAAKAAMPMMLAAGIGAAPAQAGIFSDSPQDIIEDVVEKYDLSSDASSITDGQQISKEIGKYMKAISDLEVGYGMKAGDEAFSSEEAQLMLNQYAKFYKTIKPELRAAAMSAQNNFQKTFALHGLNNAIQSAMR